MDNETSETIESKAEVDIDEYLCLLGENAYYDEQYCKITLGQVKIHQIKQLKQLLLKRIEDNKKGNFNNDEFINLIRDMMLKHTEELDDLFKIVYKANFIEENETNKAHIYFDSELLKGKAEVNVDIINEYISKLKIEIQITDK